MKLVIASDHAGYSLKEELKKHLEAKGYVLVDLGTHSEESTDYPDFAHPAAEAVEKGEVDLGVIICGTGNGINIAANKHQGVRAALCWIPEIASLARQHNKANICTLASRFTNTEESKKIVDAFLDAEFEGGRHERRVNKIACS